MGKNIYDKSDYFKILQVTQDDTEDTIRQKYRELAKFWHPDHNSDPNAMEMFQKISVAYDVLKDSKTRLKYVLLSMVYDKKSFPDMNALTLIRNMHGQEDLNLRAFHLVEITGKGLGHSCIDKIYYCSPYEAKGVIGNISKHNWTYGFLGVTAVFANIKAIIQNIVSVDNKKDNLLLFIHNALVYEAQGKIEEAASLMMIAKDYATKEELPYINQFLQSLHCSSYMSVQKWNFSDLIKVQLFYPLACLVVVVCSFGIWKLYDIHERKKNETSVKQVVVFNNGQKMYSDVAVAKIFDIPIDVYDKQKLYHVTTDTEAMHGADKSFDVYKTIEKDTTVRITGYTADNEWLRVMFDNGEMAFIEAKKLKPGIGKEIPLWSKIYKEE